jgi:hypothetical protein
MADESTLNENNKRPIEEPEAEEESGKISVFLLQSKSNKAYR